MRQLIWTLAIVLLALGCAPTYRIVARQDPDALPTAQRPPEPLTQSWEQMQITVRPVPRSQTSSRVRSDFTVFEVTLENLGNEELRVQLDQFALVDSKQVQRSPLRPEDLDRAADRLYYPVRYFSFGIGLSSGHYHQRRRPFGYGYRYYDGFPLYVRGETTYAQALHGGPIVPRAKKRGWLFFDRVEQYAGNRLDFYYLVDGKIRLVFPFKVVQES